jgi:hypothetical protein
MVLPGVQGHLFLNCCTIGIQSNQWTEETCKKKSRREEAIESFFFFAKVSMDWGEAIHPLG